MTRKNRSKSCFCLRIAEPEKKESRTVNDTILIYLGLSPLSIVLSARTIAISRSHRRLPRFSELVSPDLDIAKESRKWLKIANRILVCWALIFLAAWLMDVSAVKSSAEGIRGIVLLTAFHVALLGHTLRSALFNIEFHENEENATQENAQYWKSTSVFPGFKDPIRSAISVATIALTVILLVAIFTGNLNE